MADLYLHKSKIFQQLLLFEEAEGMVDWQVASGTFIPSSQYYLKCTDPGELVYNGSSLMDQRQEDTDSENANFGFTLSFSAIEDVVVAIRARRSDANNYVTLTVDFENGTVELSETVSGITTSLAVVNHTFVTDSVLFYRAGFWTYENRLEGYINGAKVIEATSTHNMTEEGFSIFIPAVWEEQPTILHEISVHQSQEYPEPQLPDDPSDLMLQFRLQLKNQIESPAVRTWETFKEAEKLYRKGKDFGRTDDAWARLGYPIRKPTTEAWFRIP